MQDYERVPVLAPALIGVEVIAAYRKALFAGVVLTGPDPDVPLPLRSVISTQSPAPWTVMWSGDEVTVGVGPVPAPAPETVPRAARVLARLLP